MSIERLTELVTRFRREVAATAAKAAPERRLEPALARDLLESMLLSRHLDIAALCEIDWYADGPAVLRSFNDTAHLSS